MNGRDELAPSELVILFAIHQYHHLASRPLFVQRWNAGITASQTDHIVSRSGALPGIMDLATKKRSLHGVGSE